MAAADASQMAQITQIEALQMVMGECEREASKQTSAASGLEHACEQEEREIEAAQKQHEDGQEAVARKKAQLADLQAKKKQEEEQTLDIISSKTELDKIHDEARKHRETAGESMRKLRGSYDSRIADMGKLQEMATSMKRRVQAVDQADSAAQLNEGAQKKQKLRDGNQQLRTAIGEADAAAAEQLKDIDAQIVAQEQSNAQQQAELDSAQIDVTKFAMQIKSQQAELEGYQKEVKEIVDYRDGMGIDHKALAGAFAAILPAEQAA